MPQFEALGVAVVGLSIDTKFSQKAFADQLQLNFRLVSDANRDASPSLNTMLDQVAGIRQVTMRSAMIIDPDMKLRWKFGTDSSTPPDVNQVLDEARQVVGE